MNTTKRFENAVTKLYTAFHNDELYSMDCKHCAVGNMCDNNSDWMDIRACCYLGVLVDEYKEFKDSLNVIKKTGYSPKEIVTIEKIFIEKSSNAYSFTESIKETKETQFKGLCAVVKYLCELDNIPNIMDYTSLFETENNKPIKQLAF